MTKRLISVVTAYLFISFIAAVDVAANESVKSAMNTIITREHENALSRQPSEAQTQRAQQWLIQLRPDGSWDDLDLSSKENAGFPGTAQLGRAEEFCLQYAHTGDKKWLAAAELAIAKHKQEKPSAYNWWQNEIGMPLRAADILTIAANYLSGETREYLIEVCRQPLDIETNHRGTFTGQNLLWRCQIAITLSCYTNNEELLKDATDRLHSLIKIEDGEGIQIDGSFHQHGPQIYSHGYGRGFTRDSARLAALLVDTPRQFSQKHLDVLAVHALQGQQWMMRGEGLDLHPCGREIARKGVGHADSYLRAAQTLAKVDSKNSTHYSQWAKRLEGHAPPLVGNRYYWRSDFFVHQTPEFYISARLISERSRLIERVNGENMQGLPLSSGATCLMRSGREYLDVYPLLDWTTLGGATNDASVETGKYGQMGKGSFTGGVSDGTRGAAAMDFDRAIHAPLKAKKAYFGFDNGVVCLGCDITGGSAFVNTGIQQCWQNGEVSLNGRPVAPGNHCHHSSSDTASVTHDGLRYIIPAGQNINLRVGPTTGNWHRVSAPLSTDPINGDLFNLFLAHGDVSTVGNTGKYSYMIVPDSITAENAPYKILRNDSEIQAVIDGAAKVLQAVIYSENATLNSPCGKTISASNPCIIMLTDSDDTHTLTVADPTQKLKELTITIDGENYKFDLPGEMMAGSSVSTNIK